MTEPALDYKPTRAWLSLLVTAEQGFHLTASWLLQHGYSFTFGPKPKSVHWQLPRHCYFNALHLARRGKGRYVYCEGLATNIIPTQHAWCYDRKTGLVVDNTWRTPGFDYIGVPFKLAYAEKHLTGEGDTPLMNMTDDFPVITGVHAPDIWREEL